MKLLLIGSGGREHAIAWKLAQSKRVSHIYVAPGNVGTQLESKVSNLNLVEIDDLVKFVKVNDIAFTIVGPEAPLANGIVDKFRSHHLKIWGPTAYCTQLESSKSFAKDFMLKHNIPTASYKTFTDENMALDYLDQQSAPIVIKADGLASGKGVLVATSMDDAKSFVRDIFSGNKFGAAGNKVVIEEFLDGVEASFIVMIDGANILPMATSQDHKRLLNNDKGPNTGGMGVYSPAPIVTTEIHDKVIREIIQPVIDGMASIGHSYTGFLYAGLMIDTKGNIKTLEFNCRLGDPETQAIIMRLESDLVDLIEAGLNSTLNKVNPVWSNLFAIGVVLASYGYPNSNRKNDIITGVDKVSHQLKVFHAGTSLNEKNQLVTSGGRVMCVVGLGEDIKNAQTNTYEAVNLIQFDGMQYRSDIADKAYFKG